jgi:hypothetical protein
VKARRQVRSRVGAGPLLCEPSNAEAARCDKPVTRSVKGSMELSTAYDDIESGYVTVANSDVNERSENDAQNGHEDVSR